MKKKVVVRGFKAEARHPLRSEEDPRSGIWKTVDGGRKGNGWGCHSGHPSFPTAGLVPNPLQGLPCERQTLPAASEGTGGGAVGTNIAAVEATCLQPPGTRRTKPAEWLLLTLAVTGEVGQGGTQGGIGKEPQGQDVGTQETLSGGSPKLLEESNRFWNPAKQEKWSQRNTAL